MPSPKPACLSAAVFALILAVGSAGYAQEQLRLTRGWELKSSLLVDAPGERVSRPEFQTQDWHPAHVPGTVLSALVKNRVYPDPYVGMNNMRIPDACTEFNQRYDLERFSHLPGGRNPWRDPYWYRTCFTLPQSFSGRAVQLHLKGVNYRAEVWLNGRRLADARRIVGMFGRWALDIGPHIRSGQSNCLAVKVYPLDFPGIPGEPQLRVLGPFGLNGGDTGDIGANVTMQCAVGWDWLPAVRDRNLGLWQEVLIAATGPVDIRFPHVITDLPLPELNSADIELSVELVNTSGFRQEGTLNVTVLPPEAGDPAIRLRLPLTLAPGVSETRRLSASEFPELRMRDPELWWPNGLGSPALYSLNMEFEQESVVSDRESLCFGIREVGSAVTEVEGWIRRDFFVNGRKVWLKGGAWVPDMLLNRSPEKLAAELKLCREANLNLIRIWGGGVTPPDNFFTLCDELGLMVWHDFWITGDCQGTWGKGSRNYPFAAYVFLKNAVDTVKRLRNHPCLLVWTAGNEGYPREEIYVPLREKILAGLDGTRPFIPSSGYREPPREWGLAWPDNAKAGTYSGGPYSWVDPRTYYDKADAGRDWLFKNEVGLPAVPVLESLKAFIPDLNTPEDAPFPLNHVWGYHDACEGNGKYSLYDRALRLRYGEPRDLADYVNKAQLINAESHRAIFEAVNHVGNKSAGVLLWKINPAWPSLIWQLYDWYLRPHAGYYYAKKACEPLHIQLNLDDFKVAVIRHGSQENVGLTAEAEMYDRDSRLVWSFTEDVVMNTAPIREAFSVPSGPEGGEGGVRFLRLRLRGRDEKNVSENFYWLAHPGLDFQALASLPQASVGAELVSMEEKEGQAQITWRIDNTGTSLAFFVRARLLEGSDGPEILPAFWNDNFFSLLPEESRTLSVCAPSASLNSRPEDLLLELSGMNVPSRKYQLRGH
jgi:beta-galactosidase/beta-glucuronidase